MKIDSMIREIIWFKQEKLPLFMNWPIRKISKAIFERNTTHI